MSRRLTLLCGSAVVLYVLALVVHCVLLWSLEPSAVPAIWGY